jgi:hypothetical protein
MNLSIAQLEKILRARRSQVAGLMRRRAKLARQLERLDAQLRDLGGEIGGGLAGGGRRARNAQSLVSLMESVLGKSAKPMKVGDIVSAVQARGYRSNSANFRAIVNQTLIKERKRFAQAGRGMYQLKK